MNNAQLEKALNEALDRIVELEDNMEKVTNELFNTTYRIDILSFEGSVSTEFESWDVNEVLEKAEKLFKKKKIKKVIIQECESGKPVSTYKIIEG